MCESSSSCPGQLAQMRSALISRRVRQLLSVPWLRLGLSYHSALPKTYAVSREEKWHQTPSAVPWVGISARQPLQAIPSPPDFFFSFFKNNTVYSWNFLCGQHITMAMFCLVLFWKKGKKPQLVSRASRWKSESIGENPTWFWKKQL